MLVDLIVTKRDFGSTLYCPVVSTSFAQKEERARFCGKEYYLGMKVIYWKTAVESGDCFTQTGGLILPGLTACKPLRHHRARTLENHANSLIS
jgi:hypothetical protein